MNLLVKKIVKTLNLLVLIGSTIIVASVSYDFFNNISFKGNGYISMRLQFWICTVYIIDLFVRMAISENKKRFIARNLILLVISIPFLSIAHHYSIALSDEWITTLRGLPVIRGGYTLITSFYHNNRSRLSTLFVSYITFVAFISYFSTIIFFYAEANINPMVNNYGDALWWGFMNLTTVGSNIYAMTAIGKILSVVMAATGMMMFPIFTAYITDIFQFHHAKKREHNSTDNNISSHKYR